jgi:branched-chain amino acid transport system ATP-binding protein
MSSVPAALLIAGVSKSFGDLSVLKSVDFSIGKGQSGAIIGPNGAGKTTLVNIISGVFRPNTGSIRLDGEDIAGLDSYQIARRGLVRTYQITSLFLDMTVKENIEIALIARRKYRKESSGGWASVAELLDLIGLGSFDGHLVHELSHGDQRLLEVGVALAFNPEVMLLDEPTAGMSPAETERFINLVNMKLRGRCTIILIEHDMDVVMRTADRVCVLAGGVVIAEDAPERIGQNKFVREAYLGHS